jgi:hypothetical protein
MSGLPEIRSVPVDMTGWELFCIGSQPSTDFDRDSGEIVVKRNRLGVPGIDVFCRASVPTAPGYCQLRFRLYGAEAPPDWTLVRPVGPVGVGSWAVSREKFGLWFSVSALEVVAPQLVPARRRDGESS